MSPARDLSPTEAAERFIAKREGMNAESTVRAYRHRLETFLMWADVKGIESMRELDGWKLDEYERHLRQNDWEKVTVKVKIAALDQLLKFCARLEVVDEDLPDKLEIPTLSKEEETSDQMLEASDARKLLEFFRNSPREKGTAEHVTLEVLWHVGGRMSCLRALDLGDWDPDERVLQFRHHPPTELKDGKKHERNVLVPEPVADSLQMWVQRERPQKRDENGRKPLFSTNQGRASDGTVRGWAYMATQPCLYRSCPHSRDRHKCEYTRRSHASKCPSSRGPHAIRTGSITWQLNNGLSYVKVAKRVAASPETIRRYYDKPDHEEELERRRPQTRNLDVLSTDI